MIALVEQKKQSIADLCRRHEVRRLDLFGSAARGRGSMNIEASKRLRDIAATPRETSGDEIIVALSALT